MSVQIRIQESGEPLALGVTADQLAQWKHQHGAVYFIHLVAPNEQVGAYFRPVTLDIVRLVQDIAKKQNDIDAMEALYVNCLLKAAPEIDKNAQYKLSIFSRLSVLLEHFETELVKY